jgi:hypothetical protein
MRYLTTDELDRFVVDVAAQDGTSGYTALYRWTFRWKDDDPFRVDGESL